MTEYLAQNAQWIHEPIADIKIKVIHGHKNGINNCQFVDNDSKIFTSSNDLTARLWDFESGKELAKFENLHETNISSAKISHDSLRFISSSLDKTVKCWDVETGKLLWSNKHDSFVTSCALSNDDSKMTVSVSDFDYVVKLWDTNTGKLINDINGIHQNTVTSCKFSPNNDRIITTSMDKTCKFYDLLSGKTTITLGGHTNVISCCSLTTGERTFATASWDKSIQLWDIATGMYRTTGPIGLLKGHEGSISCCQLNSNGNLCVSGGYDLRVVLWDTVYAKIKLILRGHTDWIQDVAITNDNKWIMSVGKDKGIRLWCIENCDNIKIVAEQNRRLGNKIVKCSKCLRPYSLTKLERSPLTISQNAALFCVFCRLDEQTSATHNKHDDDDDEKDEDHDSSRDKDGHQKGGGNRED